MRQKSVNLTTSRPVPNYVCFFFQIREDERKKDDALDSLYDREPHTKRIPKVLLFPLVFFVSRQRSSGLTRKHARMYRRHFGVCLFRYYYIQQQNKGRHQRRFESRTSDSFFSTHRSMSDGVGVSLLIDLPLPWHIAFFPLYCY